MRTHTRKIIVAVILASAAASSGQSAVPVCRFAGDTEAVWVILPGEGGSGYRLAVRQLGDKTSWKPVGPDRTGEVAAEAAAGNGLVVFFADGEQMRYFPAHEQGRPGEKAPVSLWPTGTKVLAACRGDGDAVLVLVVRPIGRRPKTRPATTTSAPTFDETSRVAAKFSELALLRYADGKWRREAVMPGEPKKSPLRAHLAVHKKKIYVLTAQPDPVLVAFEAGKWRNVADLPAEIIKGKTLAMMVIKDALVLATFDTGGQVNIARYASGKWQDSQPVRREGKVFTWPADAPPAIARLGDKAAMLWEKDKKWLFATCELDGRLGGESTMDAFAWADEQELIARVQNIFFMAVFGAIVVLMFWPGQTLRTAPFSLPATIAPARLAKRLAACCLDAMPFLAVALVVGLKGIDLASITTIEQIRQATSTSRFLYAFLSFLAVYPAYCFIMEYRFGATVGKMIMHLRVVADKGRKPTPRELALRNVSKAIEILGLPLVFPLLFPLLTRYRQRLGDKIAWTTVIDAELSLPADSTGDVPPDKPPGPGKDNDRSVGGDGARMDEKPRS